MGPKVSSLAPCLSAALGVTGYQKVTQAKVANSRPAHCGAAKGQLSTLKTLKKYSANLWLENYRNDLPLHEAVQSGRKDLVRWLLAQKRDSVNSSNKDGKCPLHIAAISNNVEMCKVSSPGSNE